MLLKSILVMGCTYNLLLTAPEYFIEAPTIFHIYIALGSLQLPHYHK